jgi:hypothetical protein
MSCIALAAAAGRGGGHNHSFECTVHNTGSRAGDEVVMVFQRPLASVRQHADHSLPLKRLIAFDRVGPVTRHPGTATVRFDISPDDLLLANSTGGQTLYPGTHEIVFWRGHGAEVTFQVEVPNAQETHLPVADEHKWIQSGLYPDTPHWNDTDGNRIEAHAAGMLQSPFDKRWYWYGESKKTSDLSDHGVNCYSAPGLSGPWRFEGQVFRQADVRQPDSHGPFIIERPKVLWNQLTKRFVMWFHLDTGGYHYRHVGVATSDSPGKPFTYQAGFRPDGVNSLDMSLFKDPVDGQAYHIRSCDNRYVGISRLTPDYLNTTGIISNHSVFEGMALFRHPNGTYYIITSHLTGWAPNPLMMYRAQGKTLDDPQWVPATGCGSNPTCDRTSYNTQPTYVVTVQPPAPAPPYFMYMSDNWVHGGPKGLIDASYVWLPIRFHANNITIPKLWKWDFDNPDLPTPPAPPAPPPPLVPGACVAGPPAQGGAVALRPCAAHAGQTWEFIQDSGGSRDLPAGLAGLLRIKSTNLCVAAGWHGAIALGNCSNEGSRFRLNNATNGQLIEEKSGKCVDISWCGTQVCDGEKADLYACNDNHHNQQFTLNGASGQLVAEFDSHCLTACGAPK